MGRMTFAATRVALLVLGSGIFVGSASAADGVPAKAAPQVLDFSEFQKQVQPFLNSYCINCHSANGTESDLRLDAFIDQAALEKGMPLLERAIGMLRGQKMPPKEETQPSLEERAATVEWLEAYTSGIDCSNP